MTGKIEPYRLEQRVLVEIKGIAFEVIAYDENTIGYVGHDPHHRDEKLAFQLERNRETGVWRLGDDGFSGPVDGHSKEAIALIEQHGAPWEHCPEVLFRQGRKVWVQYPVVLTGWVESVSFDTKGRCRVVLMVHGDDVVFYPDGCQWYFDEN